ncbi:uracil phosphoribosyltransferase-domain-containing protein [Boeremia exigua]|uniref:uracil phosphoribosyltransferase-domain-containing protein n=1 Tax=Boeremia exigua TaxID=749465 RepID=UPI001E8D314F|nr:uracil phosphoribosyltransferase-domain-containing protein [Boeremia exigua]KAH6621797.1 uracil phosphoribosyltransferase-domain-containing protein [Boeremia exigua]
MASTGSSNAGASPQNASSNRDPLIVGLYGVSGAGKSHLLEILSNSRLAQRLDFVDGSSLIYHRYGLTGFKELTPAEQYTQRVELMTDLVKERRSKEKGIVVGGHLLLWESEAEEPRNIGTDADWKAYTHIVYFQVDPQVLQFRRNNDNSRERNPVSVKHLTEWQARERAALRKVCYEKRISFTTITEHAGMSKKKIPGRVHALLTNILNSSEEGNLAAVDAELESDISLHGHDLETMLVLDADKTLAAQDAGALFWKFMKGRKGMSEDAVERILKQQGYSYESFRQVALLYEEVSDDFGYMCNQVATSIALHPEMAALLARVALEPHTGAVIVTCGLRQVWETVFRISGLTHVKVIGGGPLANGYVVTDTIKGHIVDTLKAKNLRVVAFGDGVVDVEMLKKADESYVVVGEMEARSASMDRELTKLLDAGHSLQQILLPATVAPRLTETQLPTAKLDEATLNNIFKRRFVHATNKTSAKILMTAMRDTDVSGHDLRRAYQEVGYYLANEYLGDILGIESYTMKHVTGTSTDGYRFQNEDKTLIVCLMRGGEPMALGVSKALRSASFVHSKKFTDIDEHHFKLNETIILVDSVVNSGKSIMEFLTPLRKLCPKVKVVVVAGVVQAKVVEDMEDGKFGQAMRKDPDIALVALRKSDNEYKGTGTTDTGHRLFNTTYLP